MSSYLSIYAVPKRKSEDEEKKHILLTSYSRSSEMYSYFNETIHPAYIGMEGESQYTTITKSDVATVIQNFDRDIKKSEMRLTEYEKYAKDNPDYIEDILDLKEYIQGLQYWRDKASFIEDMIDDVEYIGEVEEICCNID